MLIKDVHLLNNAKLGFLKVYLGQDVCWNRQLELKTMINIFEGEEFSNNNFDEVYLINATLPTRNRNILRI